jgi:DNA-binding LacI/PurR family transcriptional regulator
VTVVRLKDVAERANVSIQTVSNVVNGYVHVSDDTRARVQQAITELGYRPNISARHLRGAHSGLIALVLPELTEYSAELVSWTQDSVEAAGFSLLIDQTRGEAARERVALEGIRSHLVDGIIYSPLALGTREISNRRDTTPLVLLGERVFGGPVDHVTVDNVQAADDAVSHLLRLGRTRIAAIGQIHSRGSYTSRFRLEGYRNALRKAGLAYSPQLVCRVARWHREDGADAARSLLGLSTPPDAIFAFNDLLAIGALQVLRRAGVRVPDDIAVIGFDNIGEGKFCAPTLSTVSPDHRTMALRSVERLIGRVRGTLNDGPIEAVVPHRLVQRESTTGDTRPGAGAGSENVATK